mmetsp:Transcript_17560/g.33405  ORF Transcript_17560/g.33405 Transcript_17560/m.33405 type:complete len:251 (+) Transcript_17560:149-901(+)
MAFNSRLACSFYLVYMSRLDRGLCSLLCYATGAHPASRLLRQLASFSDGDQLGRHAASGAARLDVSDKVEAFEHFAEHHVLSIEPSRLGSGDEELGSVRVRASIGHGKVVGAQVTEAEVFVREAAAVDGFSTPSIATREVPSLDHEVRDDAVKLRASKLHLLSGRGHTTLASTQLSEVFDGFGDYVAEEPDDDAARFFAVNFHVKKNAVGHDLKLLLRWPTPPEDALEKVLRHHALPPRAAAAAPKEPQN